MWVSTNSQVQDLYSDGHEIASHTINHSNGKDFDEVEWAKGILIPEYGYGQIPLNTPVQSGL